MFTNEYRRRMDEKKRVPLPPEFRKGLSGEIVITKGIEPCLYLCPLKNWRGVLKKLEDEESLQIKQVQIDKYWRILIPKDFRKHAELEKEIVFVGCDDYFEVWNNTYWEIEWEKIEAEIKTMYESVEGNGSRIGKEEK